MNYTLKRSNRKTISLSVDTEGRVIVKAPYHADDKVIEKILLENSDLINEKIELMKEIKNQRPAHGKRVLLFGEEHILNVLEHGVKFETFVKDGMINVHGDNLEYDLQDFYSDELVAYLRESVEKHSKIIGVNPVKVTVKNQKTLWGSASTKGNLNFNFRLAKAPPHIIDYVVVHELCHLKHMNHSKDFWNLVESIIPRWKEYRKWLKDNTPKML